VNCVTSKKVDRYYYRGKGYATRLSAYKAIAKEEFIEIVRVELRKAGVTMSNTDDYNGAFCSAWAKHFPHDGESYGWAFCAKKYRAYLKRRALEIMKEQE